MGLLNTLIAAFLRSAARRWPADIRDEMARDWIAELGALQQRPGTAWRRLTFAISLAATPLAIDESGAPRGRWEWMRAGVTLRTVVRLMLVAGFGLGGASAVRLFAGDLFLDDLADDADWLVFQLTVGLVTTLLITGYAVTAARWAGSRGAPEPGPSGSLGVAATAVLPIAWMVPFFLAVHADTVFTICLGITATWAALTIGLVVATVRALSAGRRGRAWLVAGLGVPLTPMLSAAPLLLADIAGYNIYLIQALLDVALFLLPWTICAVTFGRAAVRRWSTTGPATDAVPAPEQAAVQLGWWQPTAERLLLLALTVTAATGWALGMTVLQPMSEPTGPDAYGENNTYWARELRWGALIALVVIILVYVRGDRRATRSVLLGGVAWLAADIALDRINPTTVLLPVAAALTALLCCAAAGGLPLVPQPRTLFGAALVAAIAAGLATDTESPTDVERGLNLGSAAAGSLLAVVAIVAAARVAATVSRRRIAAAIPAGLVAAATPWVLRLIYPHPTDARNYGTLAFTVLLGSAVVALAAPRPRTHRDWLRYPATVLITTVSVPLMLFPLVIASIALPYGALFTALAGNPEINSADTDNVAVILAVPIGIVLGRMLRGFAFGRPRATVRRTTEPPPKAHPSPA
ncbi:hypothetical protein ACWT_4854 [Actinoplanes sp. SE50]|uniref:hypothetical protein n=1 Tax=unclassified Actinoplanes TaxID=2626549 RepID=UPI00023EC4C9|nr:MULTISPECIES: hypothetical protein [unclassified Actinoplanes]AEV85873.1 hypothetical protein ACPL_4984 [Actinoplanes sp. SE50/110]ATO84269.1 hypothetical protein ACWT_4854 [Actinoplanes sp. SE50]SLM01679.1 hypothetical protein ACSP50_4915 [Actinoplanes sp. SE50/110]